MSSPTTPASLRHPVTRVLTVPALLLSALAAPAAADLGREDRAADLPVCEEVQVPAGSQLAFHAYASGVQIYHWDGTAWAFDGPAAVLFADPEGQGKVGIHYSGPTWLSVSGGKVTGSLLQKCPVGSDDIPWLLLAATAEGPGVFQGVNRIQRLNTEGGNAPVEKGTTVGEVKRVPYTAEYFFYRVP